MAGPTSFPIREVDGKSVGTATFDWTRFGITHGPGSVFEDLGDKLRNDAVDIALTLALKEE